MKPTLVRACAAVALTGALVGALTLSDGPDGYAQVQKGKDPAVKGPMPAEPLGAVHCLGCHSGPLEGRDYKDCPPEALVAYRTYQNRKVDGHPITEFVRLNEAPTWDVHDLHRLAHKNIVPGAGPDGKPNLAAQMQEVLEPHRPKGYKVHEAAECLTCHATDLLAGQKLGLGKKFPDHFAVEDGVSCEACHGMAGDWFARHVRGETWRQKTPAEKAAHGQADLRDPYVRAKVCASCHVGDKAEGKFVSHEIYAAGHPPLPPFELVTYCRDEPRHYFTHRQNKYLKDLAKRDPNRALTSFHYQPPAEADAADGVYPDARDFAVGTVATFETAMTLLAADAATLKKDEVLDFAHFDCYACHHDLRVDGERRKPRPGIAPGRPVMRPWGVENVEVVLQHAESTAQGKGGPLPMLGADVREQIKKLRDTFNARPFGDPEVVATSGGALAKLSGGAQAEVRKVQYTNAETLRLHQVLAERVATLKGRDVLVDHDMVQPMLWGLVVLREDLGFEREEVKAPELDKLVRLRIRDRERVAVEPRLKERYGQIYGFKRDAFFPAAEAFASGFKK